MSDKDDAAQGFEAWWDRRGQHLCREPVSMKHCLEASWTAALATAPDARAATDELVRVAKLWSSSGSEELHRVGMLHARKRLDNALAAVEAAGKGEEQMTAEEWGGPMTPAPPPAPPPAETSQRSTNQEDRMPKPTDEKKRPYVVIRNDMAGVLCGVLIDQSEHCTQLAEARIIWEWQGDGIETVHDVAIVGAGPKAKVSRPVANCSFRACAGEETIQTTAEAEASLRAAVWAK